MISGKLLLLNILIFKDEENKRIIIELIPKPILSTYQYELQNHFPDHNLD